MVLNGTKVVLFGFEKNLPKISLQLLNIVEIELIIYVNNKQYILFIT